jgi:hypothetical protein
MRTQAKVAMMVAVAVGGGAVYGFTRMVGPVDARAFLPIAAIVFPIFGGAGWAIGWLIGEPFDRQRREERRAYQRAQAVVRANRGPLNGWGRIGLVFVVIGACLAGATALWALGLMNHGGRQYGWFLPAALAVATAFFYNVIDQDRSDCSWGTLVVGLMCAYAISVVGASIVAGFAENSVWTGFGLSLVLLAPLLLLALIAWIINGFQSRSA